MKQYKIAWRSQGGIGSASFRYRALLPCKYLKQQGWSCEMFDYRKSEQYQIVIFQKQYDEQSIELVKSLKKKGVTTIFDLCDNHFYYQLDQPSARSERSKRLQQMLDLVDIISVSTPELKKLIYSETGKIPVVIDDAIEIPKISLFAQAYLQLVKMLSRTSNRSLSLVWYGNAGTKHPPYGMIDLARILPHLEKLNQEIPINLTVISNSKSMFDQYFGSAKLSVKYHRWKLLTFPYLFSLHDVCLIPVNLNPHTRYKTNNRLVLSLLLNVAAIADKIPSYEEFDKFVLFSNWEINLRKYAFNPLLRRCHIEQGKAYILSKYNRDRVISQWTSLFQKIIV